MLGSSPARALAAFDDLPLRREAVVRAWFEREALGNGMPSTRSPGQQVKHERALRVRSSLWDWVHRHRHDGLLFSTLRFDDGYPVHPPHHTICKGNLVGGFVEVIDLQLRHGVQEFLRVLPFRHKALD